MKITKFITRIFFPKKCSVCGKIVELSKDLCDCCTGNVFEISNNFCQHCGYDESECICSDSESIKLPHIAAVYLYSGNIKQLICAYKFEREKNLAEYFAPKMSERMATCFPTVKFDFVTFVPASKKAMKQRKFNQSELLAQKIAKSFFIPCEDILIKSRETTSQHTLDSKQRRENLTDSIICSRQIHNKTVLLCDDVKTTGATLNECVRALKSKGAKDVYCICIALSDYNRGIF